MSALAGRASRGDGGIPARRAVLRWSLRTLRREWRQQILICALIALAVAGTIFGAGIISGSQVPQNAGFGTANELSQLAGNDPHLSAELAAIQHHFGPTSVIDSAAITTGTAGGATIESFDTHGPFVGSMLQVTTGRLPTARGEVDLTSALASLYALHVGDSWTALGTAWHVVGEVEEPTDLNADLALAAPGAIAHPTSVTALFDATQAQIATFVPPKGTYSTLVNSLVSLPPGTGLSLGELIILIAATFGMLFIGLIAVAGFTVMAHRRTRAIGMLGALGASDSRVRLVLVANGFVVGCVAMVSGGVLGLAAWWAYAPTQQASVGHVVDPAALPWWLVVVALVMAPLTATLAARRPAVALSRLPIVRALSGRPSEPKASRRSAAIGASVLVGGLVVVFAGSGSRGPGGGKALPLLLGIVATCIGLFLLSQWIVGQLGRLAGRAPVSARIALRDLARYRSRSGAALGAICLALVISSIVVIAASARYGDPFDYVGPNLASNVVLVYPPVPPGSTVCGPNGCQTAGGKGAGAIGKSNTAYTKLVHHIARAIGASSAIPLYLTTNANLQRTTSGRQFDGQVYVGTPALLAHYGITTSEVSANALVLTARPQLPSDANQLALDYGQPVSNPNFGFSSACPPGYCVPSPDVQGVPALPVGTSAPNTVFTMHAVRSLHLTLTLGAWMLTTPHDLTALQKQAAFALVSDTGNAALGASIETANSFASLNEVLSYALGVGVLVALCVLAMTVGLIRSETAGELRVLTAAGAGRRTRRRLTAVTAAALGFVGAVLGIVTAYLLVGAFFAQGATENLSSLWTSVPVRAIGVLVLGLPLAAAAGGWCLAGREPRGLGRQPIE